MTNRDYEDRKSRRKRMIQIAIWSVVLVILVPVLINGSYSMPFVWFHMQWGAADVLGYYASILGTVAAGAAIVASVALFLQEQKNQNEVQRLQESEKIIDETLDIINPVRISKMIVGMSEGDGRPNYGDFRETIYLFCQEMTIAVDRMSRSVHRAQNSTVDELITSVNQLKEETDQELKNYTDKIIDHLAKMQKFRDNEVSHEEKQDVLKAYFTDVMEFQTKQKMLYEKFQALGKTKAEKYDREYAKTVSRLPKFFQ